MDALKAGPGVTENTDETEEAMSPASPEDGDGRRGGQHAGRNRLRYDPARRGRCGGWRKG